MQRITLGAIFVLTVFFAVPVLLRVQAHVGTPVLALIGLMCGSAAWIGHTPESQKWETAFERALMRCGISNQVAASAMQITEAQLSAQKSGREMLSLYRVALLEREHPKFKVTFAAELAAQEGACLLDNDVLVSLLEQVRSLVAQKEVA